VTVSLNLIIMIEAVISLRPSNIVDLTWLACSHYNFFWHPRLRFSKKKYACWTMCSFNAAA